MAQYIDKFGLVAEIKRRIKEVEEIETYLTLTNLLCYIDTLQEEPVSNPIDFEKELYKAFGQVKDFTLGMRIAKWFYDMGKNSQEPVSEDLEEAVNTYIGYPPEVDECSSVYGKRQAFKAGAKWQKERRINKACELLRRSINCCEWLCGFRKALKDD